MDPPGLPDTVEVDAASSVTFSNTEMKSSPARTRACITPPTKALHGFAVVPAVWQRRSLPSRTAAANSSAALTTAISTTLPTRGRRGLGADNSNESFLAQKKAFIITIIRLFCIFVCTSFLALNGQIVYSKTS